MNGIKYDAGSFTAATTEASKATTYMNDTLSSASLVKGSLTADTSVSSTVSAAVTDIEDACSTSNGISETFNAWDALLSSQGATVETTSAENIEMMSSYIKSFGQHIGSYKKLYGVDLTTNFHLGYNFVPGPNNSAMGGYVVYIPKNYNPSKPVGMSLIFHASGQMGHISSHYQAQKLESGAWEPNSIIILPRASGKAYDIKAGTLSFPHPDVQNWILELMDNIMSNYNVDRNNISVTGASSSIRGAIEFANNNSDYIKKVYVQGTLNVYNFEDYENNTGRAAVDTIRELSDKGVEVNLYTNKASIGLYDGYKNVIIHQTPGDHIELIANVENSPEYLAAIGGMNPSVNVVGTMGGTGTVNVTATPEEPLEKVTVENLESKKPEKETVVPAPAPKPTGNSSATSTGSGTYSGGGSTTVHTPSGGGSPQPVSQPISTPTTILPENRFSDVIPDITSGELESMEISSTGVTYEINSLNNTTYEEYLDQLKNSGYTLSENNTWTNSNYKVTLEYNNNFLKLILEMIGIGV